MGCVDVVPLARTGSLDTHREYLIRQTLEPVVLTALLPRCAINIEVQVLQDDGGLLAAAINGASLALVDAGKS